MPRPNLWVGFLFIFISFNSAQAADCYCQCLYDPPRGFSEHLVLNEDGHTWAVLGDAPRGSCFQENGEECKGHDGRVGETDNCTHVQPDELD